MLSRILLCLSLLVWEGKAFAQYGKLSGYVKERFTSSPIHNVSVVAKQYGLIRSVTTTNEKGYYSIYAHAGLLYG